MPMQPATNPAAPATVAGAQPPDEAIDVFGLTHPGKVRPQNQDHFLLCSLHKTLLVRGTSLPNPELLEMPSQRIAFFGMVADGVGASEGGEEASRAAIEAIAAYATHTMQCFYAADPCDHDTFLESLRTAAGECHQSVLARGRQHPELAGLATTLTLAIGVWPSVYVLHVGDGRIYRLRRGVLERLTRDQTMAQDLVDSGALPAERASRSPFASVLSSAIGGEAHPEVGRFDSEPGDVWLMCTDGLTRHVPDERIRERLLAMTGAEQAARGLLDDALEQGGTDNITVVVGRAVTAT